MKSVVFHHQQHAWSKNLALYFIDCIELLDYTLQCPLNFNGTFPLPPEPVGQLPRKHATPYCYDWAGIRVV